MSSSSVRFLFDIQKIPEHPNSFYQQVIQKTPKYTIGDLFDYNSKVPSLFVIEFLWADVKTIFENLDQSVLQFIVKRRIPILFYFPTEGFCFNETGWTDNLKKQFKKHNLQKNLKYFVTGNLLNNTIEIFDKTFSLNCFERVLETALYDNKLRKFNKIKINKKYDFLSYNANPRPGRNALASEIIRHGLNKNALFSWIGNPDWMFDRDNQNLSLQFLTQLGQKHYTDIFKKGFTPYILDVNGSSKAGVVNLINDAHYSNSYFSLISETETSDQCIFITEKTYKPIYAGHPFIIWGNPGTLMYLRSIGYKTFPTLFDESYDNELDPVKRLEMIIVQVKKFKDLNDSIKYKLIKTQNDIIRHNHGNFLKRWKTSFDTDIQCIIMDITNDIKKNKHRL
jgi:hypothetical protein